MIEILPIKVLTTEDANIFGSLNVNLAKLGRAGLATQNGLVVTSPQIKLKTVLEHFDFKTKEVFEQSLTLFKKEINKIPVPENLSKEIDKHKIFLLNFQQIKGVKKLWVSLLDYWFTQIKQRIWNNGFYIGITENLEPQTVIFLNNIQGLGKAYFDPLQDEVIINTNSKLHPNDLKKIVEMVNLANKKLLIPHQYEWIIDRGVKLTKVLPFTPAPLSSVPNGNLIIPKTMEAKQIKSAVKVFFDLSKGFTIEKQIDGIYIASEKIFDLNKPNESFENLVFRLIESAITFPNSPIFFKLADLSEGMGKLRGTLRLLHQKSLFDPLIEALDFARHKKSLLNVHVVIPFVRGVNELLQIKRELAVKKLMRKNSLQMWMEVAVPENIINLDEYLIAGLDGVVLNLDELIAHLNGFDHLQEDLMFYKNEVNGLIKFLEDGIRLLHKSKIPFIAYGLLSLIPKVLEFLVEKGVQGIVVEKYEAHSAHDLLYQTEKRMVLAKSG